MKTLLKLALLILLSTQFVRAATYYVDYSTGSDSNAGTSKGSPWKHAPGMLGLSPSNTSTGDGCTATCNSTTINPGDSVILKGGVVWPNTVLPWNFTFNGSATTSTYGCTGTGCIYIGYDPTWNLGIVNSVTLTRDLGGCNPSSPPTVSFSGGGGTLAAATALVIPAAASAIEPNVAGFIYHINVTNQGSAYTSNPTVAIVGGGCTNATAVADILRPVIDAGGSPTSGPDWPVGTGAGNLIYGPGLTVLANYVIVDHLEIRNIRQVARNSGITTGFINLGHDSTGQNTASNNYLHGRYTDDKTIQQEGADDAINLADGNDEVSGNIMENGDSFYLCAGGSQACGIANLPDIFSEHDASTRSGMGNDGGEVKNNTLYSIRWMTHLGGNATPLPMLIHNNEMWLVLYDVGNAHVNEMYLQYQTGTVYNYNNIFHNAVSGASNQQQTGNGTTQYFFNNVSWGLGGGTSNYGVNQDGNAGAANHFYFFNNTMASNSYTRVCLDDNMTSFPSSYFALLQNNHCITNQSPYFGQSAGTNYSNSAGGTSTAAIEAASTVQSQSLAATQGYLISNLFAPANATGGTVTFSGTNLTSFCNGLLAAVQTACKQDINGLARGAIGNWNSGAYQFTSGGGGTPTAGTPTCDHATNSYIAPFNSTCSVLGGAPVICYTLNGPNPVQDGVGGCGPGSTQYTGAIPIGSPTITLRLNAGGSGFLQGPTQTYVYTFNTVGLPSCIPAGGSFTSPQTVPCSASPAAFMAYTTDGSTPVIGGNGSPTHGTQYTTSISIGTGNTTLKIIAGGPTYPDSPVVTYNFIVGLPPASKPTCNFPANTYPQPITLTCSNAVGATMYYTTDGITTPSVSGTVGTLYTAPVTISSTQLFQIVGGDGGHVDGPVLQLQFTITQPNNGAPCTSCLAQVTTTVQKMVPIALSLSAIKAGLPVTLNGIKTTATANLNIGGTSVTTTVPVTVTTTCTCVLNTVFSCKCVSQ